jgi:hypothetical protein
MRQAVWSVALACALLSSGQAWAITGSDYQRLSPNERAMYVAGTIEGWFAADTVLKARPSPLFNLTIGKIARCVSGRLSTAEVRAIVDKYVARHPAERKQEMGQLVILAMDEVCRS